MSNQGSAIPGCNWGPKDKTRVNYIPLEAIDPRDGKPWTVLLSRDKLQTVAGRIWAAKTLGHLVPWVLQNPLAIFAGIREKDETQQIDDDCWLVYVASPPHRYLSPDVTAPPPSDMVFCVYLTDERVIFNWRWERADADGSGLPRGHSERYRHRIM